MSFWVRFGGPWADYGRLLALFGDPLLHLGRIWDVLGAPWMYQGVLLEPIGFILTCFEHQKFIQSGPGWHSDDMLKSNENMVFWE